MYLLAHHSYLCRDSLNSHSIFNTQSARCRSFNYRCRKVLRGPWYLPWASSSLLIISSPHWVQHSAAVWCQVTNVEAPLSSVQVVMTNYKVKPALQLLPERADGDQIICQNSPRCLLSINRLKLLPENYSAGFSENCVWRGSSWFTENDMKHQVI